MNGTSQSPFRRIARPGDIFILLVPMAQELHLLREQQQVLQSRFGGEIIDFVHITCDRFSPEQQNEENACIELMKKKLKTLPSFMIYTDQLVQFFAPYWDEEVLRWQVQETEQYSQLRDILATSLLQTGCGSHFERNKPTTCTALRLEGKINFFPLGSSVSFPAPLFKANKLWVSKLVQENKFEILEKIRLDNKM